MRKVISGLAAIAVLVTACGGTAATPTASTAPTSQASLAPGQSAVVPASPATAAVSGTVNILVHQNPPMVGFMQGFNAQWKVAHPGTDVNMIVVGANDLATQTQTHLSAKDVDIVDISGFANASQSYMKNTTPPAWQTLIQSGLLADLTSQPFVKNYDPIAIKDAGTVDGKVYEVNLGRVIFSGLYVDKKLFTDNSVKVPTTWSELVTACQTFKSKKIPCMTTGGKDGWPIFVGAYGIVGNAFPDAAAYVQGLWTGSIKFNDAKNLAMWEKLRVYAEDMLEPQAAAIGGDQAPGRFASGAVAMFAGGSWYASAIESANPKLDYSYIPFPSSDVATENQSWYGKYDMGWSVAENGPNKAAAMQWLSDFSAAANYDAFANAVGFIPTQPTAKLTVKIGTETAPFLNNFHVGYELCWVDPKGMGQYGYPRASFFSPFGKFKTAQEVADAAQADLDKGLAASK